MSDFFEDEAEVSERSSSEEESGSEDSERVKKKKKKDKKKKRIVVSDDDDDDEEDIGKLYFFRFYLSLNNKLHVYMSMNTPKYCVAVIC